MADIHMPQKNGKRKTNAPRIDFTPMVDLGFILMTFFIYTTTMARPNTMEVNMPSNEPVTEHTHFIDESTITLIPVHGHKVIYYNGGLTGPAQLRVQSMAKLLDLSLDKKKAVKALPATFSAEAHKLHVLIKPNDDCKYEDVVNVLDDMNILDVPYYAIVDISAQEKEWVKTTVQ
jgi:biopolymer transport protein ExbD